MRVCSDTENSLDAQVPFLPSVEVLVKALIVISSEALAAVPSAIMQIIFCSHHPCIVGTGKRNAVWRVYIFFIILDYLVLYILLVFFLLHNLLMRLIGLGAYWINYIGVY